MSNASLYLTEVRHIADRWDKNYRDLVQKALTFLQINAALLTLIILIRGQEDFEGGEILFNLPITLLLLSSFCCIVTFLPIRVFEMNIDINFKKIDEDESSVILNSLIYQYIKKIKGLRIIYHIKIGFFISGIIFFGLAIWFISQLILNSVIMPK